MPDFHHSGIARRKVPPPNRLLTFWNDWGKGNLSTISPPIALDGISLGANVPAVLAFPA
jgi:hypothetical protein